MLANQLLPSVGYVCSSDADRLTVTQTSIRDAFPDGVLCYKHDSKVGIVQILVFISTIVVAQQLFGECTMRNEQYYEDDKATSRTGF